MKNLFKSVAVLVAGSVASGAALAADFSQVPTPGTLALVGIGLAAAIAVAIKRK